MGIKYSFFFKWKTIILGSVNIKKYICCIFRHQNQKKNWKLNYKKENKIKQNNNDNNYNNNRKTNQNWKLVAFPEMFLKNSPESWLNRSWYRFSFYDQKN